MIEPTYEHDCDECIFLEHFGGYDIYIHKYKDKGITCES